MDSNSSFIILKEIEIKDVEEFDSDLVKNIVSRSLVTKFLPELDLNFFTDFLKDFVNKKLKIKKNSL